jgi:hypothetical protein
MESGVGSRTVRKMDELAVLFDRGADAAIVKE